MDTPSLLLGLQCSKVDWKWKRWSVVVIKSLSISFYAFLLRLKWHDHPDTTEGGSRAAGCVIEEQ